MIRINIKKSLLLSVALLVTFINASANSAFLQSGASSSSEGEDEDSFPAFPVLCHKQLFSVEEDFENGKETFQLTEEAMEVFLYLEDLGGPVYVVGLHGGSGTGKSTNLSFFVRTW